MLGVLLGVMLLMLLCSASSAVKGAGALLLVLPRAAGLLETVRAEEIAVVPMDSSSTAVTFPFADAYHVYVADLNLLEIAEALERSESAPWLVVHRADTGESVPVEFTGRGLMPYDDPRVPGRPVFRFVISDPGAYVLSHPRRPVQVYLVPDRTTGRESTILLVSVGQLGIAGFAVGLGFGRPYFERRRRWREHQAQRRAATEEVLRRRRQRPSGGGAAA